MAYGSWQLDLVAIGQTVSAVGIASTEAFGSDKASLKTVTTGIASANAFGSDSVAEKVNAFAIASAQAFGTDKESLGVATTGIASAQAFGSDRVALSVAGVGISSSQAFGSDKASLGVSGQGIATAQAIGSDSASLRLLATGIASGQAFGADTASLSVIGSGIASAVAFGSGTVSQGTNIAAVAIASQSAFGISSLSTGVTSSGIVSGESFGQPGSGNTTALGNGVASSSGGGGWVSRSAARIIRGPELPIATLSITHQGIDSHEAHGEHVATSVPVKAAKRANGKRAKKPPSIQIAAPSIAFMSARSVPRAAIGIRCRSLSIDSTPGNSRIAQGIGASPIGDSSSVSVPSIRTRLKLHRASKCRRLTRLNTRSAA